jgi:hypothetical protein
VLETVGPRLDRALEEVSATGSKLRVAAGHVEGGAAEVHKLLATAGAASDSLRDLHGVGTALVPAIAAAIQLVVGRVKGRRGERAARAARDRDPIASDASASITQAGLRRRTRPSPDPLGRGRHDAARDASSHGTSALHARGERGAPR